MKADTIKQLEMKDKIRKRVSQTNEKTTWNQALLQESLEMDKTSGQSPL